MITLYTKPDCVQCEYTKKFLDQKGLPYTEIDIDADRAMAAQLRATNQLQLPYVVTGEDCWSGFKLEKLRGLT